MKRIVASLSLIFTSITLVLSPIVFAEISDGADAIGLLGQTDYSGFGYDTTSSSFATPQGVVVDTANHRLFVSDSSNNRVLVFNLDSHNDPIDGIADNILGASTFDTSVFSSAQNGLSSPTALAYDAAGQRLFVGDYGNLRVMVFDVSSITDNENAINVLGAATFTSGSSAAATSTVGGVRGLAYDSAGQRLFVTDSSHARVLVFDVASITNGEDAINVLGQTSFTGQFGGVTQSKFSSPHGLAYDSDNQRLFVAQSFGNRVTVFDVASITNGENAISVLGQPDFVTSTSGSGQSTLSFPHGVEYDATNERLFVAESSNNRVTVFDVASITNGENAVHVLGQADYSGTSTGDDAASFRSPGYIAYAESNGRLYVTETNGHRLKIFDGSGPDFTDPVISDVNIDESDTSATVTWETDEDASSQVEYGVTVGVTSSTTISDISPRVTSHSVVVTGLNACTSYFLRVKSADASDNTATSSATTFTTDGCVGDASVEASQVTAEIDAGSGDSVSLSSGSAIITLDIPAGYSSTDAAFQIKKVNGEAVIATAGSVSGKEVVSNLIYDLQAYDENNDNVSVFDSPITITLSYQDDDIDGIIESSLVIYRYDGSVWSALSGCLVNEAANTISCETTHFSTFAIFGSEEDDGNTSRKAQRKRVQVASPIVASVQQEPIIAAESVVNNSMSSVSQDLFLGYMHEDVRLLQKYLNTVGFTLALQGPGSPGNETSIFGPLTQTALARFQAAHGIVPAVGYFGPITRAYIQSH